MSSNPAFLAYLGLPISHIGQNPKNAQFLLKIGVRGFPLRPIPSLGAMGPGPGHLGKFFSVRRRRRRRRRRPWRDT